MLNITRIEYVSSTIPGTRAERADRLRDAVHQLVEGSSWRQAAEVTGVSVGALQNLVSGSVPHEKTLSALEDWAVRTGRLPPAPDLDTMSGSPKWKSNTEIGHILDSIRRRCGATQARFAEMLGVAGGQADVSKAISGKRRLPYESLEAAARLIGEDVRIFQEPEPVKPAAAVRSPAASYKAGNLAGADPDLLREMWRRVDAVDQRSDLTPLQREMVKERELQMFRQCNQDRETRVAEMRTRIIGREVEIQDERTRALGQPEVSADLLDAVLRSLHAFRESVPPPAPGTQNEEPGSTDAPGSGE